MTEPALLSIENVSIDLPTPRGNLRAVDQVDLRIGAGRTLGIVGESGCGKTMLSRAILQLLPKKAKLSGRVTFDGQDLVRLDPERLRKLRGRSLAVAVTIVVEGALSLLGLGVPPPLASWGSMIGEGRESLDIAPWLAFLPAGVMFLTVLSFNLVGDGLRAITDPRQAAP